MSVIQYVKNILSKQPVRYLISSCVAFAVDYAVLLVLNSVLHGAAVFSLELSAVAAFALSSQVNFWINRKFVFRSAGSIPKELGGYYSLALASFCVKTFLLLELFVRVFGIPLAISKPLAEVIMFGVNFLVQKKIIFKKREKKKSGDEENG